MAYVHEIKFFIKNEELYVALFDKPPFFCNEFWLKNVLAEELGISELPENIKIEKKYSVKDLGIKPFQATKPEFEFNLANGNKYNKGISTIFQKLCYYKCSGGESNGYFLSAK